MESNPTTEVSKDRQVNVAPPGNKNALKHGLHAFKPMLDGDGLDQRSSLFRALRAKENELITSGVLNDRRCGPTSPMELYPNLGKRPGRHLGSADASVGDPARSDARHAGQGAAIRDDGGAANQSG